MRKFNFDNLDILSEDRFELFSPFADINSFSLALNFSFAAPLPIPLFAEINGTSGDDTLTGTADDDTINGLAGDDIIYGNEGNDILDGGAGRDTLYGGLGDDILTGGANTTTAFTIDYLYGGAGNDTLNVHEDGRRTFLIGGEGDDIINVPDSNTHFTVVFSSANLSDYEITELAPDQYQVRALNGVTDGTDVINSIPSVTHSVSIRLGGIEGTYYNLLDLVLGENLDLTEGDDLYNGTYGDDVINGLGGNDVLYGLDGNDTLNGGDGDDVLFGGEGGDTLNGGDGIDTVNYEGGTYSAFVDLTGSKLGSAQGDSLISIENLSGTTFRDIFRGTNGNNVFIGLEGDDLLQGRNGNDTLIGGVGDDELLGDEGDDTLMGGVGDDELFGGEGNDLLFGGFGDDIIDGGNDVDTVIYELSDPDAYLILGSAAEGYIVVASAGRFALSDGQDELTNVEFIRFGGETGTNFAIESLARTRILGTDAADTLSGAAEDDIIFGGDGDDIIDGGDGNDLLFGGEGYDILNGGSGDDWFFEGEEHNGGAGFDIVDYSSAGTAVGFRFGSAGRHEGIEGIIGSQYKDYLTGDVEGNLFMGLGGDDIIDGDWGTDLHQGIDRAVYLSDDPADYVITLQGLYYSIEAVGGTGEGTDTLRDIEVIRLGGIEGTDYYIQQFLNDVNLTNGNDVHTGNSLSEHISGLDGDDVINGGNGDDVVNGNAGNDTLDGGFRNDIVNGGDGDDILTDIKGDNMLNGGAGDDVFLDTDYNLNIFDGGAGSDTVSYEGLISLTPNRIEVLTIDLILGTTSGLSKGDTFISVENIVGSRSRNVLRGDNEANALTGGESNDYLSGRSGDDIFTGLEGYDEIIGGFGSDTAVYSSANASDYIVTETAPGEYSIEAVGGTGEGTDTLTGIETIRLGGINGTDYAIGDLVNDGTITLTNGDDVYSGTLDDEVINALDGNDIIDGGAGANTLNGDAGNDTLISLGNDILNGGTGDDLIEMGGHVFDAATTTDGGADIDTISFSTLAQLPSGNLFLVLDLQGQAYSVRDGSTVLYVDQFTNFENATGSEFGDLLQGDAGHNILMGLGGDDNLQGRAGDDIIDGGAGGDALNGGDGIDLATYASAMDDVTAIMGNASLNTGDAAGDSYMSIENITGSDFDDTLGGDSNANVIDGGDGVDIASYAYALSAIVFDGLGLVAGSGDIVDDTLINIEGIGGTSFDDRLFGDNGVSIFYGGEGNDRLFGRNGDDQLYGEGGDDIILGGRDNDLIDGGAGNDQLRGNEGDDTLLGGDGNDVLAGGAGADAMDGGAGIDRVEYTYGTNAGVTASLGDASINTGDAAGDTYIDIENLYGTTFNDALYGDAENNRIDGRLGDDMLFGGDGNDYLIGGAGDDVMNGEAGNDLLLGQAGADIYQFDAAHGTDRIVVFTQGEDLIEFTESVFDFSGLTITQDGAHVNIDTAEGRVIVNNSIVADFASDDFIFASPPSQEPLDINAQDMTIQDMAIYVEVDALI